MNAPKKTFLEEFSESFRWPAIVGLGLLALATLAAGTWIAGDLLDRVVRAFSTAAREKASGARSLHALVAAILWCSAVVLAARRLAPDGMIRNAVVGGVAVVAAGLFLIAPNVLTLAPLWAPIALIVLVWVAHVVLATHVPAIAMRELANVLLNPLGYVVLTVFAIVLAILFSDAARLLAEATPTSPLGLAPLLAIFGEASDGSRELNFLVVALLIIVPVITMRLVAEEKRSGTEEVLLTAPVREWHIIAGKFVGTYLFYLLMCATAIVPIYLLSTAGEHFDWWQVLAAITGMAYIGFGLLGIGTLASAVTKNQLAAAVLTFLGMLVFTFPSFMPVSPTTAFGIPHVLASYVDLRRHLEWIARGTIDSRTVFLFLSVGLFCLFVAVRALETRRWAGFSVRKALGPLRLLILVAGFAGLVYGVVRVADYTGERQIRLRAEALRAEEAARAEAEKAAEAARKRLERTRSATPFEDATAPEPAGKIGSGAEPATEEAPPKEDAPTPDAPKPDSGTTEPGKAGGGGSGGAAPAAIDARADETVRAEWTPARLIQVVGAALIGLILFLAIFARVLSGGLRNQIVFGSNVIVAGLAALTLVVLANYLANRNHKALDLTRGQINSLHPVILAEVDRTLAEGEAVEVLALVGRHDRVKTRAELEENIRRDALEELFERFAESLNRPGVARFSYSFVDPLKDPNRRNEIVSQFNVDGRNNVIVRYRDRHEVLDDGALFSLELDDVRVDEYMRRWRENRQRGGWMPEMPDDRRAAIAQAEIILREMGNPNELRTAVPRPEMQKVIGEAIIQLVEGSDTNLYYTVGHGEKRLDPPRGAADIRREFGGASLFRQTLAQLNYEPWPLAPITGDREIPGAANFVLIAGPTQPFAQDEIDRIRAFVERGGNLIVLTEAGHDSGLAPLLETWGITIDAAQIWMASMARMGRGGLVPDSPWVMTSRFPAQHPVIEAFLKHKPDAGALRDSSAYPITFFALSSPITIETTPEIEEKWKVTSLIQALEERGRRGMARPYAETELNANRPTKEPNERTGPFDLAVLIEPTEANASAGKVVVISDTDFIEDKLQIPMAELGVDVSTYIGWQNDLFMEELLRYLKGRSERLKENVEAPLRFTFGRDMTRPEFNAWKRRSQAILWLALPTFFVCCGVFVFWVRRKS